MVLSKLAQEWGATTVGMTVKRGRWQENKKAARIAQSGLFYFNPGDDLRSHTVARAVSSARRGLTSVFGMGTGVTLAV